MIDDFPESELPDEMVKRLKQILKEIDENIFKKEGEENTTVDEFEGDRQANVKKEQTVEELTSAVQEHMAENIFKAVAGNNIEEIRDTT